MRLPSSSDAARAICHAALPTATSTMRPVPNVCPRRAFSTAASGKIAANDSCMMPSASLRRFIIIAPFLLFSIISHGSRGALPLVNPYVTCYNRHRKNVPSGIFPESSVIFIENNRSTGQSWAVISFWLSREYSLLPRRETQSRQSQTFRSPPFGGKKPPQVRGRSTFIIVYAHAKSQTYYRKACLEHALQTGFYDRNTLSSRRSRASLR